jgi:aminomethyltransferase
MSPSLGKAIGMGYVKTINSKLGTEIFVIIRNKYLKARIVSLPFWKN